MDQKKIGLFLKQLRKEQNLTQQQLAEQFNVSDRTVSRWETGTNLPDLSILIELADFYNVDIREIIEGERRSGDMNEDVKETLVKIAEYSDSEKKSKKRKLNRYFAIGGLCLATVILDRQFDLLSYIFVENASEFVAGVLCSLGILFEIIGFYNNNHDVTLKQRKMSLINSLREK